MKKASKVVAWTMTAATSLWLVVPSQAAMGATYYRYKWVDQTPTTLSADGKAHVVSANAGDTVNMSVTLTNLSSETIKPKSALGAIPAGKQVPVGSYGIGVRGDALTPWLDASSFVLNGNRLAYYDGATDVAPGANFTVSWTVKVAATAANGTYNLYFRPVFEYKGWTRQVAWNGKVLPTEGADIFTRFIIGGGSTTPATGGLSVSVASGTPAAGQIANNANANFTKVTLTPASGASVSLTSLYVTRSGLSVDAAVQNVKLIRASDNVQVGNTAGGFDANHKAQIFFSPALVISSPTDFYIRAGIVTSTTTAPAGNTVALGIAANSDIVGNATSVNGAPVTGNQMTIVNVTVGTITLAQYGAVADSTPDAGDKDVTLNTFQLTAGSTEDMIVEQITVMKAGTANSTDTNNIELVNDTTGTPVATVASWNAENKAVFNFSPALTIAKGNTVRFLVRIDIVSGSGLTVNADIVDGSDGLIVAKGALYGYYINPTVSGSWNGTPTASQTINSGALVISKASSTAATGSVAIADNQNLGTWAFDARGEDVLVSALHVNLAIGQVAGTPDAADVTNARLFDSTGNIVVGPIDGNTTDTGVGDGELDFTSSFIVAVGVHNYTLKVRLGTDFLGTDTIVAEISANGDITARTIRTNTSLVAGTTITGAAATLNTMTVKAVTLSATTLLTPAAQSIALGVQDHVFMTATFSASGSGEDVRVTAAPFQVATTNQADPDALINMEIWADLTAGTNSPRGDKYETQIVSTQQPSGSNAAASTVDYTWTFSTPLTVKKDSFIEIAFIGDVAAGGFAAAGNNDTITVELDEDGSPTVTAAGVDTGTDPACTPAAVTSKSRTVEPAGAVTITVDSSSPQSDIMVGGSTGRTVAVYRAANVAPSGASTAVEAVELDQFVVTNGSTGDENTGTWYLYSNRDGAGNLVTPFLAASAPNGATVTFNVPDNTIEIPKDAVALFTIKADILSVDGVTVVNGDTVDTNIADLTAAGATGTDTDADFTGMASGAQVPGTGSDGITSADHELYKSRPYISFAADTPSGALGIGSSILLAKINITADAAYDIAFTYDGNADDDDSGLDIDITALANDATDASGGAQDTSTWLVNMATGDTLDTDTTDPELGSYTTTFDFSTKELLVAAGTTAVVGLYGNTLCFEDTGDSIQAWLSDATDANVAFGTTIQTNGASAINNSYAVGQIVLRGDKYAGTLVKA